MYVQQQLVVNQSQYRHSGDQYCEHSRGVRAETRHQNFVVIPAGRHNYSHYRHSHRKVIVTAPLYNRPNYRHSHREVVVLQTPAVIMGGLLGGAIGNQLGNDQTRVISTMAGAIIGTAIANDLQQHDHGRW
jgi:uncharacterized protein YcfJ